MLEDALIFWACAEACMCDGMPYVPKHQTSPKYIKYKKKHSKLARWFSFSAVTTTNALKLIKCINMTKAMGEDEIPPKLTKTAGSFLSEPLTDIINFCFSTSTSQT